MDTDFFFGTTCHSTNFNDSLNFSPVSSAILPSMYAFLAYIQENEFDCFLTNFRDYD